MKVQSNFKLLLQLTQANRARRRGMALGLWLALIAFFAFPDFSHAQGTLTPGVQTTGSIGLPGGSQSWTFAANAGDSLVVRVGSLVLTGTNSLDPYIKLYTPGGVLQAQTGGYGEKGEEVTVRATNSGTFSAIISAGGTAGDYRITLGRTGQGGQPLINGFRTRGAIDVGSLDTWTFNANAGDGILVRMGNTATNGLLDPYLRLYDPSGALVSSVSGYGFRAEDVSTRATNSGIFTVFMAGGSVSNGGFGSYRITLAKTGDPVVIAPGTEGGPMTNGFMHTGTVDFGDAEVWTFHANAGDGIYVRMGNTTTNGLLDPYFRLYDPSGALLSYVGGYGFKAEAVSARATNSGTFMVVLTGANNGVAGVGDYRIKLAKTGEPIVIAPGDVGGPMTNGFKNTGTIVFGDAGVWTFHAAAGDGFVVRMGNTTTNGTLDPYFLLYDPSGALLQNVGGYGYKSEDVGTRATNSGTFMVVLTGANNGVAGVGDYRMTLAKTGDPIVTASGDEGGPMTNGFTYTGKIDPGDLDAWSVAVNAGDSIAVRMGDLSTTNALDPYLRVYAPDGTFLANIGGYGSIVEETALRATTNGAYLFTLEGNNGIVGGSGAYRITLGQSGMPAAVAAGDEGGPLVSGVSQTGSIPIGDLDVWTFTSFAGTHPTVSVQKLSGDAGFLPELRVYGPDGTLKGLVSDTTNPVVTLATTNTGLYTVLVSDSGGAGPYTGTYQISFQCGCGTNLAVLASDGTSSAFSGQLHVVPLISTNIYSTFSLTNEAVGIVTEIQGTATITHLNQSPQPVVLRTAVYMEDVIQTGTNSRVVILFCDNTSITMSENTRLHIDNYVYDPNAPTAGPNYLAGIFVYLSGLIGKNDPGNNNVQVPFGSLGIRGDASDWINRLDVLLNPAAVMQTASPVTLYTAVNVPSNSFTMGFDYAFLQAAGTFNVAIGGVTVFSDTADDYNPLCFVETVSFAVTNPAVLKMGLAELTFNFDGPAGIYMFVDNIVFPGLQNGDFSNYDGNWFSRGHGNVKLTATVRPLCSEYTQLYVANNGSQNVLSWPGTATNYVLQVNADIGSTNWLNVTNAVNYNTNSFSVTLPNDSTKKFYRLFLQCN